MTITRISENNMSVFRSIADSLDRIANALESEAAPVAVDPPPYVPIPEAFPVGSQVRTTRNLTASLPKGSIGTVTGSTPAYAIVEFDTPDWYMARDEIELVPDEEPYTYPIGAEVIARIPIYPIASNTRGIVTDVDIANSPEEILYSVSFPGISHEMAYEHNEISLIWPLPEGVRR